MNFRKWISTKRAWIVAALLIAPRLAMAAADPVSLEVKWNVKTMAISTTGVTSFTLDPGGFGSAGYAVVGGTQVQNGVDGTTLGNQVAITTMTQNVVGFSYTVLPVGGIAQLQWTQTIKTPPPSAVKLSSPSAMGYNNPSPWMNYFSVPQISTSSIITVPSGTAFIGNFEAQVSNPIFYFTGLTASGTTYVTIDYGVPRSQ